MATMRRFYRQVEVRPAEDGAYAVVLDGRPVRTPEGRPLAVPAEPLARAIAGEWAAQESEVRPEAMPCTRLAATALDRVAPMREVVVAALMRFAETDLVCYRAADPPELAARQNAAWQPLVDWARRRYGAPLTVTTGILPVPQPAEALERLRAAVDELDDTELSAVQALAAATGSLLLALAVREGRIAPEQASEASQIDESFQVERWGEDDEAARRRAALKADVLGAGDFLARCRA